MSLPSEYYDTLKEISAGPKRGFGSLRVEATIGSTTWKTSIFPDSKSATFLLPIKKDVRTNEHIVIENSVEVRMRFIEV